MLKLPTPVMVEEKFYKIHGLYVDQDMAGWTTAWRSFRASLFHLSLHAANSDFRGYAPWAKDKEVGAATFAVSLVEDLHILTEARNRWTGVLADLAYASFLSAQRLPDPDEIDNPAVRVAAKLLLSSSGIFRSSGSRIFRDEDKEVVALAERARMKVEEACKARPPQRTAMLNEAAQVIYTAVAPNGSMSEIPYFPFTEAHGPCDLFEAKLVEGVGGNGPSTMSSALAWVGLREDTTPNDSTFVSELREILASNEATNHRVGKMRSFYETYITPTRLEGLDFPLEDYGAFMRVRSDLAGPIKNVRDQLMMVRNVLDDVSGHDSGAQLDTQAVMQVMATGTARTDVFEQLLPTHKDEAWMILIDSSKSISSFAQETRGIATCLAEILGKLIRPGSKWAMLAFNNSIQVIKDFSESYGITNKARIGGMMQRSTTLLPDALQVGYKALNTIEAGVKILVVVSDGYPSGYNGIDRKLIQVVKDISKSSIYLMGVGVDSTAIKEYFPLNCVLSSPYEMMKTFAKSYFELSYMF